MSHSTVSRVLNDKQGVLISEPTRARILETAARMDYRPNRLAQALQGATTGLIGILLPAGHDYFFSHVEHSLRKFVEEDGYELLPFAVSHGHVRESWHRMLSWDMDGIFVFDYLFHVDGLWEALVDHIGAIPPMIGLFSSASHLQDYVTFDFRPAMREVLEHFTSQGARSIGYMAPPDSFQRDEQRYSAYLDFMVERRLPVDNLHVRSGDDLCECARLGMFDHLDRCRTLPDALFCQNDEIALGAYRALHERGIKVPESMLLSGCDDIPYVGYLEQPLTTLFLPVETACRTAWRFLQQRLENRDGEPLRSILDVSLKVRSSSLKFNS